MASILVGSVALLGCGSSDSLAPDAAGSDAAQAHDLTRNDMSVLFPLPAAGADTLWKATTVGVGGPLLPQATFALIGQSLTFGLGGSAEEYAALRIVALRFDPCFHTALTGVACQPQIRAIWQAVNVADGTTHDGAVHTFYNLDETTFLAFAHELAALTALAPENTPNHPLDVSPALAAQGINGAYGRGLKDLVSRYAGQSNLSRLTFLSRTDALNAQWNFGGRHLIANPATGFPAPGSIEIYGTTAIVQQVDNQVGGAYHFKFMPEATDAEGVLARDATVLDGLDAAGRTSVHAFAVGIQDPTLMVPDQTDCASCHVAEHAASYLESIDPTLVTAELTAKRGPRHTEASDTDRNNLRSFGYFIAHPTIAQRTANETEAVVAAMAALLAP